MKKFILIGLFTASAACNAAEVIVSPHDNMTEMVITEVACPIKNVAKAFPYQYFVNNRMVGCWSNNPKNQNIGMYNIANDRIFFYSYQQLQTAADTKKHNETIAQANFDYNFFKNNPNWGRIPAPPVVQYSPPPVQIQCWNNGFGTVQCGSL